MDADSCPVKAEIVEIAQNFGVAVSFVASYNHMTNNTLGGSWHYVDSDKEAADLFIMNHVHAGDIAVTQDIGLASTLLAKNVSVLSPRGSLYDEKDIEAALHMRYLSAKARRQGKYGKGPKPFTTDDRICFEKNFTKLLSKIKGVL
ncbi:UPF0178 protein Lmo1456 [Robertmurraya siralis]|uniref:UPF0178 protein J27TS8_04240 n=1 Tax=Robertmurraya siralis TaxID=77777 RepID=A0A919WEF6_9BACI|nr:DUF188 domain-containing protein [Robertmurraya siralis]PAE21848.1 DUF188 domain-containing protein [Bacillus sp. 7504-2]GIN60431.1 UPF0178 protein Lmo1456 [Robertmurraya siralis]